jgi:predicted DNA-binding transcriptional regulator AlpA
MEERNIVEKLLTIEDLAAYLNIAPHSLYQRRYRGDSMPRSVKLGGRVRFRASDVERWIEEHTEGQGDEQVVQSDHQQDQQRDYAEIPDGERPRAPVPTPRSRQRRQAWVAS